MSIKVYLLRFIYYYKQLKFITWKKELLIFYIISCNNNDISIDCY